MVNDEARSEFTSGNVRRGRLRSVMRTRGCLSIAVVLVMLAPASAPVSGQRGGGPPPEPTGPIPRTADGKPDLSGGFAGTGSGLTHSTILEEHGAGLGIRAGRSLIIDPPDGIIPYQPWALAERDRRRLDVNAYEDPVGHCEPYDIGRLHSFAQRIVYSGGNIIILAQQHTTRVVHMNRREHLPDSIRLWQGDSVGWWEGDTLVVETTNFNGKTRMALGGDFYSANATVVERFTMVAGNTINWTMTITDPYVFTRPWTMESSAPMTRGSDANRAQRLIDPEWEHDCHEGNIVLRRMKNLYEQAHGVSPPGEPIGPRPAVKP